MNASSRRRLCLAGLLAVGLLHGLMQARLRPLYQVSDEIHYIFTAQLDALAAPAGADPACISPPDGTPLPIMRGGGKRAFQWVTSSLVQAGCSGGRSTFPLFWLRGLSALSLVVLVACTWGLARVLWPARPEVAALAGAIVAAHPVVVKYGSGVTPDAWANALAAVAFLSGARLLTRRGRWFDPVVLVAATALALAWKETSGFLLLHGAAVLALLGWRGTVNVLPRWSRANAFGILVTGGVLLATAPGLVRAMVPTYDVGQGLRRASDAPARFALDVVGDLLVQAPGMLASSWTSLGNFGATELTPVPSASVLMIVTAVAALAGWVLLLAVPRDDLPAVPIAVASIWGLAIVACLAQPSLRQVLLDSQDVHQGRWLFPLMAPVAALTAAGLVRIRPTAGWATLWGLLWLTGMWLTLGRIGQWYYAGFPDVVLRDNAFTRAVGGGDVGDPRIWRLIEQAAIQQSAGLFWWHAALLLVLGTATLRMIASLGPDTSHDRHPLHR